VIYIMNKPVLSLIAAILVVAIDSIYLNAIKGYFGKQIQDVQKTPMKLDMSATVLAYVFIVFAINYFIIHRRASVSDAFLLGLVIYGIYEFTNKALLTRWTYNTVIIDTLWGGILFALVTYLTYAIASIFKI